MVTERPCKRPPPGEALDVDYDVLARGMSELDVWLAESEARLCAQAARRCLPPPPLPGASLLRRACRWLAPRFPSLILSVRFRRAHGGEFSVNGVKEWWP